MVYKKFVKRGGKVYGPFYYTSKRVGNKVVSVYLGENLPEETIVKKQSSLLLNKNLIYTLFIILAFAAVLILILGKFPVQTGNVVLEISPSYKINETISGNLKISLKSGEFIPADSQLKVILGSQEKIMAIRDLISDSPSNGSFYIENREISGQGEGYGVLGTKRTYPEISFSLRIIKNLEETNISEANETTDSDESEIIPDENATEEASSIPETTSEIPQETSTPSEPSSETPQETPAISESETPIETPTETPSEPPETSEIESPSETSESSETPTEAPAETTSETSESSPITGNVIAEKTVEGSVSNDSFAYMLEEGETAELVSGSVKLENGSQLEDSDIDLDENDTQVTVTSNYYFSEKGFGANYLEDESSVFSLDLTKLNLTAEPGELKIILDYNLQELASEKVLISVEGANMTLTNENITANLTSNLSAQTIQKKARLGEKVKWVKSVNLENESQTIVEIPKIAENITVNTGEKALEVIEQAESLTGNVVMTIEVKKEGILSKAWGWVIKGFTGRVIEELNPEEISETDNSKLINLTELNNTEVAIEYETPAPYSIEENKTNGKEITIIGPEEVHYKDITAYTDIQDTKSENVHLYWIVNNSREEVSVDKFDLNNNSLIDYIEWNVPSLSNQTYELILITKAQRLDSKRYFVEEIYDYVKNKDNNWTSMNSGEYARVRFEKNLNSGNDITLYAKSNSSAVVEVYAENENTSIAVFSNISSEGWYKVYLTNLTSTYDTFDLKFLNSVDLDYIVDPYIDTKQLLQNVSDCAVLNTTNAVYILNQSITTTGDCFNISANNITLNFAGYNITGNGGIGIEIVGYNSTTIKNGFIYNFGTGIYIEYSKNNMINNMTVNSSVGLSVYGDISLQVSNITILNSYFKTTGTIFSFNGVYNFLFQGGSMAGGATGITTGTNPGSNLTFKDTTIDVPDTVINTAANSMNISFLNVTYVTGSTETISVGNSQLFRQWYLDVQVNDSYTKLPLSNANVSGWNNTGTFLFSVLTGSDGRIPLQSWTDYVNNGTDLWWAETWRINTTKLGYNNHSTTVSTLFPGDKVVRVPLVLTSGCYASMTLTNCGVLSCENTTYTLLNSVNTTTTCFNITANNITLNFAGFNATGDSGASDYGVYNLDYNSTTIKNGFIYNFGTGILYFTRVNTGTVYNNTILTQGTGISLGTSSSNNITANIITTITNNAYGISLGTSSSNSFVNNIITTNGTNSFGIDLEEGSSSNIFSGGIVNSTNAAMVFMYTESDGNNNNLFRDMILVPIVGTNIQLYTPSINNTFLNVTYNTAGETVDAGSSLVRQWYVDVNVTDSTSSLQNANVSGFNFTGQQIFSQLTSVIGKITTQEVTEYVNNGGTKAYATPHTINTTLSAYISNSTIINLTLTNNSLLNVKLTSSDTTYPTFSSYWSNNGTLYNSGIGLFNVTITNTNGSVYLNINGTSIQATNITANVYNVSFFLTNGTFFYNWSAYGNGTSHLLNYSENKYYTVSLDTTPPVIYLISPVDATSSTTSAYNFTFNITDLSAIGNCSLIIDNKFYNYLTSPDKNVTIGMYNSSLSVASHTWQVNCTDIYGNQGNSSSRSFSVTTSGGQGETGGSTSGGVGALICSDECSSDEIKCYDSSTIQKRICGKYDGDSCKEYSNISYYECSRGESCDDGICFKNSDCSENWMCDYTECQQSGEEYFAYPVNCIDVNDCGSENNKPEKIECENNGTEIIPRTCVSDWDCSEWGKCSAYFDVKQLLEGSLKNSGKQERICKDNNSCKENIIQKKDCSLDIPIEARKTEWCNETYVELWEKDSGELVSRVKETEARIERIDIGFIMSNLTGYCDYCYDGIKNYDEDGIDCGGSCQSCIETPSKNCTIPLALIITAAIIAVIYICYLYSKKKKFKLEKYSRLAGIILSIILFLASIIHIFRPINECYFNFYPGFAIYSVLAIILFFYENPESKKKRLQEKHIHILKNKIHKLEKRKTN